MTPEVRLRVQWVHSSLPSGVWHAGAASIFHLGRLVNQVTSTIPCSPTRVRSRSGTAVGPLPATHLCPDGAGCGSPGEPICLHERVSACLTRQSTPQLTAQEARMDSTWGWSVCSRQRWFHLFPAWADPSDLMTSTGSRKARTRSGAQSRSRSTACGSSRHAAWYHLCCAQWRVACWASHLASSSTRDHTSARGTKKLTASVARAIRLFTWSAMTS
jgi:hypothetical protein